MGRVLEVLSFSFAPELSFDHGAAFVAERGGWGDTGDPQALESPDPGGSRCHPAPYLLVRHRLLLGPHQHPVPARAPPSPVGPHYPPPPRNSCGWEGRTAGAQEVSLLQGPEAPGHVPQGGLALVLGPPLAVWPWPGLVISVEVMCEARGAGCPPEASYQLVTDHGLPCVLGVSRHLLRHWAWGGTW